MICKIHLDHCLTSITCVYTGSISIHFEKESIITRQKAIEDEDMLPSITVRSVGINLILEKEEGLFLVNKFYIKDYNYFP